MSYVNSDKERDALMKLHGRFGTWAGVQNFLAVAIGRPFVSMTMVTLVAKGERNSKIVSDSLVAAGVITRPPRKDVRRCWKGTLEEAEQVDLWLLSQGYDNLNAFVVDIVLGGHDEKASKD
jgi:hypothetical protein